MEIRIMPLSYKSLSGASTVAQTVVAEAASNVYVASLALASGTYTITCASSTVAVVDFYSGTTYIGRATTTSGSISYNLATPCTTIRYYINTGSNIVIAIQLSGQAISYAANGILDTLTTSQTYNQTGPLYFTVVGGGGSGGSTDGSTYRASGGGGSGGVYNGVVYANTSTVVVVGIAGVGGNSGGASSFGNFTANGGGAGGSGGGSQSGGSAGTPGGAIGGSSAVLNGSGNAGATSTALAAFGAAANYVTGGGGGAGSGVGGGGGGGANPGLGLGGSGAGGSGNGGVGIGYGAGGGGSSTEGTYVGRNGSSGSPGVVFVIRGA